MKCYKPIIYMKIRFKNDLVVCGDCLSVTLCCGTLRCGTATGVACRNCLKSWKGWKSQKGYKGYKSWKGWKGCWEMDNFNRQKN